MEGEIDYIFACVGTGGTISGIGKKIKEKVKNCKIIGIDPYGSILAKPDWKNVEGPHNYNVEGIGNKFLYEVLDYNYIDDFIKIGDKNSFLACREIMKEDGIFPGGSSGACLAGTVKYLKRHALDKNKNLKCVLIFADGTCNYMSKFVDDNWMVGQGYYEPEILYEKNHPLKNYFLKDFDFIKKIPVIKENEEITIKMCKDFFNKDNYQSIALVNTILSKECLNGRIDKNSLVKFSIQKNLNDNDSGRNCKYLETLGLDYNVSFAAVQKMLEDRDYIYLVKKEGREIKEVYSVTTEDMFKVYEQVKRNDN